MKSSNLSGSTLLITGGTGSFGTAVIEDLIDTDIKEIRVFSRDEKKQDDLRLHYSSSKLKFLIGDIRSYNSIQEALRGVDYVFHAAALKQVPSCEFYPFEAIQTNVVGAENLIRACISCDVKRCVLLSTDKAVYPTNAMGLTKALMEKVMIAKSRYTTASSTVFCATRYGNVMASRGSVIPLFVKQLTSDNSLTITDPKMTRFLMSLSESVELVKLAFKSASPGDIFVQKAPSATVGDIAEAVQVLLGKSGKTTIIGTRHGEKLFETLVSREEMSRAEDLGEYFCIPSDTRDLNYDKYFLHGDCSITEALDYTSHNTRRLTIAEIVGLIRPFVANYVANLEAQSPNGSRNQA